MRRPSSESWRGHCCGVNIYQLTGRWRQCVRRWTCKARSKRTTAAEAALPTKIASTLRAAGRDLAHLTTADLAAVDEFHIRGRQATLELAAGMEIGPHSRVLDIGSGLGGPARTLAEACGCHVTGIDLTPEFCTAATEMSRWVGLAAKVSFSQGDATALAGNLAAFDAAMTIHVAMNIAAKDAVNGVLPLP